MPGDAPSVIDDTSNFERVRITPKWECRELLLYCDGPLSAFGWDDLIACRRQHRDRTDHVAFLPARKGEHLPPSSTAPTRLAEGCCPSRHIQAYADITCTPFLGSTCVRLRSPASDLFKAVQAGFPVDLALPEGSLPLGPTETRAGAFVHRRSTRHVQLQTGKDADKGVRHTALR